MCIEVTLNSFARAHISIRKSFLLVLPKETSSREEEKKRRGKGEAVEKKRERGGKKSYNLF